MAPRPSAHTTSHSDPTRSSSPLPLRFPPSEAWLFGFSEADPGSDASPRLCVHFAKQQKFIAQVIDRGAAASLHLTRCPHSFLPTLLSLFSQCTICGVREKEAKKGGFLVIALPITSHMNLSFPIRKTESLIIPAHKCAGLCGCWGCGEHVYSVTSLPRAIL